MTDRAPTRWLRARAALRRRPGEQEPAPAPEDDIRQILTDIRWELRSQRKYWEMVRHRLAHEVHEQVEGFTDRHQLGFQETLARISDNRLSYARFGDGEFRRLLRVDAKLRFQPASAALSRDLLTVLTLDGFDHDRLMLGFPQPYRDPNWSEVWLDIWPELEPLLRTDLVYGNAHVSRPVFFQQLGASGVKSWRRVWDGEDVVVVTGKNSRFELIPELFDNVASNHVVHSTPTDAYADLPRLMTALEAENPDALYLVALGPAGTLAAARLSQMGRWAIDVGHLNDSYNVVFRGGIWPEKLPLTMNH